MAYRFKAKEDLRDGVRRIAVEQLDKSLASAAADEDRVAWVHETRKALKRTRSLLRCVRTGIGDARWRDENTALGLIGRQLSALRDSDVMGPTLAALAERGGSELDEPLAWFRAVLAKRSAKVAAMTGPAIDAVIVSALAGLEQARDRLHRIDVEGDLDEVVAAGIARCQRTGRSAVALVISDPTDDNLHELRKAVQTYQRQQALVQVAWPELQTVRIEAARHCARVLGEAQDLAVLAAAVKDPRPESARDREAAACIVAACREQQGELREAALPIAARLFALRPKAAGEELAANWRTAVEMGSIAAPAQPAGKAANRQVTRRRAS